MSEALIKKVLIEKHLSQKDFDKMEENISKVTGTGIWAGKGRKGTKAAGGKDYSRRAATRHKGQSLNIETLVDTIKTSLEYSFPDEKDILSPSQMNELVNTAKSVAKKYHDAYAAKEARTFNAQVEQSIADGIYTESELRSKLGETIFFFRWYGEGNTKAGINKVIDALYEKFQTFDGRDWVEAYRERRFSEDKAGAAETPLIRGHGKDGLSVAETKSAVLLNILYDLNPDVIGNIIESSARDNTYNLDTFEQAMFKSIALNYQQTGDIRGLKATYVYKVVLQDTRSNAETSAAEQAFIRKFNNEILPDIAKRGGFQDLPGSSTLKEKAIHIVFKGFLDGLDKDSVTIKLTDGKKVKLKTGGKVGKEIAPPNKKGSSSKGKGKKGKVYKRASKSKVSLRNLIPLLNAKLPQAVRANMHSPALVSRTGRFAESAKIVDITRTPKGYPSVAYDYLKTPYKLFEFPTGDPNRASQDRDPRKIIDKSIREAAIGIMEGRFFTRRV